jgi:hypothetical protein
MRMQFRAAGAGELIESIDHISTDEELGIEERKREIKRKNFLRKGIPVAPMEGISVIEEET